MKSLFGAGVLTSALASFAAADPGDGYHSTMHGAGGWFMMPIMMLIFFGLLILAVVLIARMLGYSTSREPVSDNAKTILRERFAKGEIERDDFETRLKALGE